MCMFNFAEYLNAFGYMYAWFLISDNSYIDSRDLRFI